MKCLEGGSVTNKPWLPVALMALILGHSCLPGMEDCLLLSPVPGIAQEDQGRACEGLDCPIGSG